MIPELGHVYGLTPDQVWEMTQRQMAHYMAHHDEMTRAK